MGPAYRSAIFEHYHLGHFHYRFFSEIFSRSQENLFHPNKLADRYLSFDSCNQVLENL
jgi:hypothetical protein